ncbi:hypothetical protein HG531_013876 [Fusarium graminearum]|nr:hypothetical protein HG531_013876 [Fusarium graminearum]
MDPVTIDFSWPKAVAGCGACIRPDAPPWNSGRPYEAISNGYQEVGTDCTLGNDDILSGKLSALATATSSNSFPQYLTWGLRVSTHANQVIYGYRRSTRLGNVQDSSRCLVLVHPLLDGKRGDSNHDFGPRELFCV